MDRNIYFNNNVAFGLWYFSKMNKKELEIFKNLEIAVRDIAITMSALIVEFKILNSKIDKVIK